MPKPYDVAFRGRAVAAYEAGEGGYHEPAALRTKGPPPTGDGPTNRAWAANKNDSTLLR